MTPTMTSEAPMIPVQAAMMVHIRIVAIARPPFRRPVQMLMASKSLLAIPERSSMVPMKMKRGTAART